MEAIKELVKLGLGISILAPWVARRNSRKALARLPWARAGWNAPGEFFFGKGHSLSLAQQTFIGLCSGVAENLQFT